MQEIPFCEEFARSLAVALYRVPSHRQNALIDALGTVVREKAWFRRQAADLGLDEAIDSKYRPAAAAFAETLKKSTSFEASPSTMFATVWAVEATYGDAWSRASPIPPQFGLGEEQWSSEWFAAWLKALEEAADEAIAAAGPEGERDAEAAVLKVLEHERAFWAMTYEDVPTAQ